MARIIEVRNLSKKYLIYHELQSAYSTLVETLSYGTKRLLKRINPFAKNPLPPLKACEEFWALKDVNIEIEDGDRIGIIGKNGAGKSTFLKIISRIIEPTSGWLKINGRVASLLEVGTGFHPELTGRENIFLNGAILGMKKSEIKKKFDEIVAFSEIEQFLDTPVKRYSSGMYTRLGFAVAAHLDPDILIIDEVLAVGDIQFQEKCFKKINELGKSIRTVLFVSHNLPVIASLCNKGVLFEKGKIKTHGAIDKCVNEYLCTHRTIGSLWEGNLGDDFLRIYKAYLTPSDLSKNFYSAGEMASITLEYEVIKSLPDFALGFCIFNSRGQLLARSFVGDEAKIFNQFSTLGKHRLSYSFPVNFFRDDEYYIYVFYGRFGKENMLGDQIGLKLPVYSPNMTTNYSMRNALIDGVFLGADWVLE
ncbi:putative ABC transporter ATP-binding protein wzt [Chlamydiales bacterium STE3]|nr:putative ABC transporter ATP-binding protein wzt [Chlamydiales bacterium STE3]